MQEYKAPLTDMQFVLRELVDHELLSQLPGFEEASLELGEAVLEEAAKFATGVLSPLNRRGDEEGVRWHDTEVSTASGWKEAYGQFVAGGWAALSAARRRRSVSFQVCQMRWMTVKFGPMARMNSTTGTRFTSAPRISRPRRSGRSQKPTRHRSMSDSARACE